MSLWWRRQDPGPERRGPEILGWPREPSTWSSYQEVDASRGETSLQSVAVGAAVELITSLVSELPVDVYSGTGRDKRARTKPGYLDDPSGEGYGAQDWTAQALISELLRGNLFGDVLARGPGNIPIQVSWFHPDCVGGWLDRDGVVQWSVSGRQVDNQADFWHLRVNPVPGRVLGLSPIAAKAAMIGLNITGTRFGLQWFSDGGHPGGLLTNSEVELDKTKADDAKARFMAAIRGSRGPVVLGKGWEYKQVQIAPEESQFLETQKWTGAECARIFGPGMAEILGYETGGSLTYNTVQGKSIHLLVYTMNKWVNRVERLYTAMLPRPQYAKLNRDALLQNTTLERFQAYAIALRNRWKTVNEVRDLEDESPVAWGDEPNPVGAGSAAGPGDGTGGGQGS